MRLIALSLLALLTAGCATLTDGSTQEMSFQSNPEEAVVTVTHRVRDTSAENAWQDEVRVLGKTPLTLRMDRAEKQSVTFSKEGYKPLTMKLATTLNGYFWGNLVTGGVFGSTTDSMSGAMYEYSQSQYFVTLIPMTSSPVEAATQHGQREKAKDLIIRRYTNLMADLSRGTGEDLSAVLRLLHVEPAQEADAKRKMQALSQVYTDAAIYADRVIDLYLK